MLPSLKFFIHCISPHGQLFQRPDVMRVCILALSLLLLDGCGTPEKYREDHKLTNLHIVFLDNDTLHDEWAARTGQSGVEFMASRGQSNYPQVKTLKGFFDFTTNTLFCPKWNFEVCGHELHHAALGHFHEPH